jgi:hypothetical protein
VITSTSSAGGITLGQGASLAVASNGVLNIEGEVQLEGVLTNYGTVNWQAGQITVFYYPDNGQTGEIWNEAGRCGTSNATSIWLLHIPDSFTTPAR